MQPNANAEGNRTPEIDTTIKHTVPWRVTSVIALPDARLQVTFVDGTGGEIQTKRFLSESRCRRHHLRAVARSGNFRPGQGRAGGGSVAQWRRPRARCDV